MLLFIDLDECTRRQSRPPRQELEPARLHPQLSVPQLGPQITGHVCARIEMYSGVTGSSFESPTGPMELRISADSRRERQRFTGNPLHRINDIDTVPGKLDLLLAGLVQLERATGLSISPKPLNLACSTRSTPSDNEAAASTS